MKRIGIAIAIVLLFAGLVMAQTVQWPTWAGGTAGVNQVKRIPLYCPTEGDYVARQIGTANDTSAAYVLPPFAEAWLLTKCVQDTSGDDSVDVIAYAQGKFSDELITGYTTRAIGWFNLDSSMVITADTLGGDLKKIIIPPGIDQFRVIWDGITGNEAEVGNQESTWLILKY